jgi:hypothetical protein
MIAKLYQNARAHPDRPLDLVVKTLEMPAIIARIQRVHCLMYQLWPDDPTAKASLERIVDTAVNATRLRERAFKKRRLYSHQTGIGAWIHWQV